MMGCGMNGETLDSIREVVDQAAQTPGNESLSTMSTALNKIGNASGQAESDESAIQTAEPPFPQRQDPFRYPRDGDESNRTDTTASVADIQVLGFASIDEPTVLLRTKNGVKSLKVGDRVAGVTVISIHESAVELKLGSLVWTATMFDASRN